MSARRLQLAFCLVLLAPSFGAAGPITGYKYGATGTIESIRDVTSDPANCGAIGAACAAGQICCYGACCSGTCTASNQCCAIPACGAWQTCGSASNQCGNSTACGVCGVTQRCAANQCFDNRAGGYVVRAENASNQLVVVAGSAHDMEVTGLFVSSKGAYATAMSFDPASGSASCNIDQSLPGCPQYTLECSSCPADPNADPGELSCWCNRGSRLQYSNIPAGTEQAFSSALRIDFDQDRKSDDVRSSSAGAGNLTRSPVRYYPIVSGGSQGGSPVDALVRFEWEDDLKPPDGDFNDYVGALSVKDCDNTPFPPEVKDWPEQGMTCWNGCSEATCPPPEGRPSDLRVVVAVGVDDSSGEQNREARGRMITVSVAVYGMPATTNRFAVCPVAWFGYPGGSFDCSSTLPDATQVQSVGSSKACNFSSPTNDIGCSVNNPKLFACQKFPVALAAEQLYGPLTCSPPAPVARTGPSDAFELPPVSRCGSAGVSLLDFQIQQKRVDDALTNGKTVGISNRKTREIMGFASAELALQTLDLYIVDNISGSATFRCPSGVNVDFGGVDPGLGKVRKFTLRNEILAGAGPQSDTFRLYVRK